MLATLLHLLLSTSQAGAQQFNFESPDPNYKVQLAADNISHWLQGESEMLHLQGNVVLNQGEISATADEAIIWIQSGNESEPNLKKLITYLEGQPVTVRVARQGESHQHTGFSEDAIVDRVWHGRFYSLHPIQTSQSSQPLAGPPPPAYERAHRRLFSGSMEPVRPVTFLQQDAAPEMVINPQTGQVQQINPNSPPEVPDLNLTPNPQPPEDARSVIESGPVASPSSPTLPAGAVNLPPTGTGSGTQVQITGRDPTVDLNLNITTNPANPNEQVWLGSGGVRVTITSPDLTTIDAFRADRDKQIIILADNVVAWQSSLSDGTSRWELYLEGNVIFAKEQRVIYADQLYYDANYQKGTILNADFYTPIQNFEGLVRMKASVLQQVDANNLTAHGAAFTTSRLAFPRYWLQSERIDINRVQGLQTDALTGAQVVDPQTGLPATQDEYFATSRRNRVYANGLPVFAWPRLRTSLNDPSFYLRSIRVGNDDVFGFQLLTTWDLYQLLGFRNRPEGSEWLGSLDYLSDRGIALGSERTYQQNSFLGIPGAVRGIYRSWFIRDQGLDNLGRQRTMLVPPEELRGRILWRHFQRFSPGYNFRAEFGYISDRNFLESFYEREYDTVKDALTGFWLERNIDSQSFNLLGYFQINPYFAQTSWLPRFDHFALGQTPFDRLPIVYNSHSHVGYGALRAADPPTDPVEIFVPLAWEADVEGVRAGTRQELDFPMQFRSVKVVPYVLGDVTYWQEDLNGNDVLRGYGQAGIRATLPMWKADPTIQSELWNINGLAHKVNFDFDAFYADSSQDLSRFPLYDQVDDDSQEAFRRRFAFNTFGIVAPGNIPLPFDERYFAFRNGMQSNVTAHSLEIADDLSVVRFGVRQRWQTKRGMPGNQRTIDWITFNVNTSWFPNASRDNFGADFGLFNYDFRWFIGDRTSLVSDGYMDFFSQAMRTFSVGVQSSRPGVGDGYLGFRTIEGPISSNILSAAATYRMSEKWGLRGNSQVDFGEAGAIGNALSLLYIGESFLWQFGVNVDFSRSNYGFRFGFEPRFVRRGRLFRPGRESIPAASSVYLE